MYENRHTIRYITLKIKRMRDKKNVRSFRKRVENLLAKHQ
jgi:hypothetical protein